MRRRACSNRWRPSAAHPNWPLIVVQTALHEGYPWRDPRHVAGYPFGDTPFPPSVPQDLARSLCSQRERFAAYGARFVPIDFTLPEDGYEPEHYGLDALWAVLEDAVPLGLRAMLQEFREVRRPLRDIYFHAAQPHILSYAIAAGAAGGVPVPMVDIPLCVAIQAKMFHTLASIYGQDMTVRRMTEIFSTLGLGISARLGGRELLKLIPVPGFGSAVSALFAAASTYALGCTLCRLLQPRLGWGRTQPGPAPKPLPRTVPGGPSAAAGISPPRWPTPLTVGDRTFSTAPRLGRGERRGRKSLCGQVWGDRPGSRRMSSALYGSISATRSATNSIIGISFFTEILGGSPGPVASSAPDELRTGSHFLSIFRLELGD